MLEQEIRRVEFETEVGKLTPRFGPLMNDSHLKQLYKTIEKEVDRDWKSIIDTGNQYNLRREEVVERIMNREFPSLEAMNREGWKLESFAYVLDDNKRSIQVAIFSRES